MGLIRSKCYKFIKKLKKSFPRRQVFIPPFKQRLFCRYLLGRRGSLHWVAIIVW